MRLANSSENADGGLDDLFQFFHFASLRYACFEYCQLVVRLHKPYRKRHTQLRIVAFGAAHQIKRFAEQLTQPFLYYRFAIAAGNAYYRYVELFSVSSSYLLQRTKGVLDIYNIAFAKAGCVYALCNQKIANSCGVCVFYEIVPITFGDYRHKKLMVQHLT